MNLKQLNKVPLPVLYTAAAMLGIGIAWWLARRAISGVANVVDSVGGALDNGAANVASPNNLVYRGVNGAGHWFFGLDENKTIGTAIYDAFHHEYDPNEGVPNLAGHKKIGSTWYGYDTESSIANAVVAADSQIAKDIATYGGGYGALTK